MAYIDSYASPLGEIRLSADDGGLTGLWFAGQKYADVYEGRGCEAMLLPAFDSAKRWLDVYFSGKTPDFSIPLHLVGTDFQKEIWAILRAIPYGKTVTYGQLAAMLAKKRGLRQMSAQAVGGAVGRNPISILVPCHRVVGTGGSLTGYAGGLDRKLALLQLEGVNTEVFFMPEKR